MLNQTDANILQEYIINLERENQAKTQEQFILYRQLQALQKECADMEKYYVENRVMKVEVQRLKESLQCSRQKESLYENRLQEIQQLSESNIRLENYRRNSDMKICNLEQQLQLKTIRLREIEAENATLKLKMSKKEMQNGKLTQSFQQQYDENAILREKIDEFSREINMQNMQDLVQNYQKIEQIVLQKEQNIRQLQQYIFNLEHQCQDYVEQYRKAQSHIKQLQAQVMSLQASQSIEEDSFQQMTEGIPKIQLIRQNNKMLERIMQLEKQNRNHNDQRYAYSECGDPKRDSPSKLQMRIQTLKMENENLMRNLAI